MIRVIKTILFILYVVGECSAQKETTWWYFNENAGIEFSQLPPIANIDVNDSIFNNGINGSEDVTSFSDSNGRLLFYASLTGVFKKKSTKPCQMAYRMLPLFFHLHLNKEHWLFPTLKTWHRHINHPFSNTIKRFESVYKEIPPPPFLVGFTSKSKSLFEDLLSLVSE